MDPNLFAIDGERLLEVMLAIVVLSFLVERALAVLFENRWFVERFDSKGVKEPISVLVALGICRYWDFDAVSVILTRDKTHFLGHLVTAGIIAGGSKASVKLFHDVLNIRSSAEKERQAMNEAKLEAAKLEARIVAVQAPPLPPPPPVAPVVVNVAPAPAAAPADSMPPASNAPPSGVVASAPDVASVKAAGGAPPAPQRTTLKPPAPAPGGGGS
jgi:hypothetical protein